MSTALSKAIYARLTGGEALAGVALSAQQQLAGLLGTDADTGLPAVHFGAKSDVIVYPTITFHPAAGAIDGRFAGGLLVENGVYDFEYWENGRSGAVLTDIDDCVERLLDQRRNAPPLSLATGMCLWCETFTPLSTLYDDRLKAWFGLIRYRFIEART